MIVGNRMHHTAQAEQEIIASIMMGKLPTASEALTGEREWIAKDRWRQIEAVEPVIGKALAVEPHERRIRDAVIGLEVVRFRSFVRDRRDVADIGGVHRLCGT